MIVMGEGHIVDGSEVRKRTGMNSAEEDVTYALVKS